MYLGLKLVLAPQNLSTITYIQLE